MINTNGERNQGVQEMMRVREFEILGREAREGLMIR